MIHNCHKNLLSDKVYSEITPELYTICCGLEPVLASL